MSEYAGTIQFEMRTDGSLTVNNLTLHTPTAKVVNAPHYHCIELTQGEISLSIHFLSFPALKSFCLDLIKQAIDQPAAKLVNQPAEVFDPILKAMGGNLQ